MGTSRLITALGVGTGRALRRGDFDQEDELDCLEEIPGWNRGSKGMEKVWIPEQSSVAGARCLGRLVTV